MILDFERFAARRRPLWEELEAMLARLNEDNNLRLALPEVERLLYLYQAASSDLTKVRSFSGEHGTQQYLEGLVARAYAELQGQGREQRRWWWITWFTHDFPRAVVRNLQALLIAIAIFSAGSFAGAVLVAVNEDAKEILMPFSHLLGDPSERVANEESNVEDQGGNSAFASYLMTHNIRVSIFTAALGLTYGVGSVALLFSNGVMLGAVALDYVRAGESVFLAGWLLPHGSVEIPSILLAGQVAMLLARAMIGDGRHARMFDRFRAVRRDVMLILGGLAVLLVWAGIIESFFSQYHEPVIPYWLKITFGGVQLAALGYFLFVRGRQGVNDEEPMP